MITIMKRASILTFIFINFVALNVAKAQDIRSNHSYKNLGFTQIPTVSIGGYIDVLGGYSMQNKAYSGTMIDGVIYQDPNDATNFGLGLTNIKNRAPKNINFAGEASLLFKVSGINDYGFKYGAVMELNANSTYNSWNNDLNATKAYIYGEGVFGKIEFGSELGASQKMKIDAGTFAGGPGGINGKYLNFVNLPSIYNQANGAQPTALPPMFILIPEHPTAHGGFGIGFNNALYYCDFDGSGTINSAEELSCYDNRGGDNFNLALQEMQNAVKVSYYTPNIFGFQLGVSYTPDTGNKGVSGRMSSRLDPADIDDVIEYGATYSNTFFGLGISLSFTGQHGTYEGKTATLQKFREKLQSFQYGVNLSFYGLTLGASYGDWGRSLQLVNNLNDYKGNYFTAGLGYEFAGSFTTFGYFQSEFQNNRYSAYSVTTEYKVAQGFVPYIEYTHFEFKPDGNEVISNKGDVILVGFILNF